MELLPVKTVRQADGKRVGGRSAFDEHHIYSVSVPFRSNSLIFTNTAHFVVRHRTDPRLGPFCVRT